MPGRIERLPHRLHAPVDVPEQLARVRHAGVRREVRTGVHHRLERVERLLVPSELEEGVADDAVAPRIRRGSAPRPARPWSRAASKSCRARASAPSPSAASTLSRPSIRTASASADSAFGYQRGIAGHAALRDVREPERRVAAPVVRDRPQSLLQSGDRRIERAGADDRQQQRARRGRGRRSGLVAGTLRGSDEHQGARHQERRGHPQRHHRLDDRPHASPSVGEGPGPSGPGPSTDPQCGSASEPAVGYAT